MKNRLAKFRDWCNLNQGFFGLLAVLIALYAAIPFEKVDFSPAYTFFGFIGTILTYKLQIPIYVFFPIIMFGTLYFFRIKSRYKTIPIAKSVLKGKWRNEWVTVDGRPGNETAIITSDLRYQFEDGRHFFDLKNIKVDPINRQIEFVKVAVQPDDNRKLLNRLTIENNDLLVGTEDDHKIRYVRIEN
jgi:hypothetical protein